MTKYGVIKRASLLLCLLLLLSLAGCGALSGTGLLGGLFGGGERELSGRYYLTLGTEDVYELLVTTSSTTGGCHNADGSLMHKGEKLWVDQLDGFSDLRGVTLGATDRDGTLVWSYAIPDTEDNADVTAFEDGDWSIYRK